MKRMAATDPWKRYLDAGLEFADLTRKRAEKVVNDLVKAGEIQREHAQERVEELLERSRKATEKLAETVCTEVTRQLSELGLVPDAKQTAKKATSAAKKTATKTAKKATSAAKKSTSTAKKAASGTAKKAASTAKKATGQS